MWLTLNRDSLIVSGSSRVWEWSTNACRNASITLNVLSLHRVLPLEICSWSPNIDMVSRPWCAILGAWCIAGPYGVVFIPQ